VFRNVAASLGATLLDARAVGLDPDRRCFHLDTGAQVAFDIASIDVGITSEMKSLPGFAEFGVPAKPLANFATKWDAFRHSTGPKTGAAGATPHGWIKETGLALHDGFITVDPYLQTSLPNVFAVGDCAHMKHAPRPKAGVFAVRQAPVLTANLHSLMSGQGLQAFHPQADYLKLVSLGGKRAFGEKKGIGLSGRLMWRLKDKIDRDFMDQFKTP